MSARLALREATTDDHARVDALFSRVDFTRPADYRIFLQAQAEAFLPVEAELDRRSVGSIVEDWPRRRRGDHLLNDLALLKVAIPPPAEAPNLSDPSSQLGALYVLEGSRLGGKMLGRRLDHRAPCSFLLAGSKPDSWSKLLKILDKHLYTAECIGDAAKAARATFALFEAAGRRHLESQPA